MFIEREGKLIELTPSELYDAWLEKHNADTKEWLEWLLLEYEESVTPEEFETLWAIYDNYRDRDDRLGELEHDAFEGAMEAIKEQRRLAGHD